MMLSFSVGYTARDLVYQWTAGRGVNIARYQHQIVMMILVFQKVPTEGS